MPKREESLVVSKRRGLAQDAGVVMLLILLSRLLGFVRERAIADVFGLNWQTDAFRLAFLIPDLMYFLLIAGGLNAAFVPVFTGYLARGEDEEAWTLARTFFFLVVAALLLMVALGTMFTPQLTPLVAYGYQGEPKALLITLIRFMFPAVFFTALAGAAMGIHKAYRNFAPPMWGPIAYNAAIIASTYVLGRAWGVVGMAYGTVAGAVANFAMQLPFVWKKARGFAWGLSFKHPGLAQVFRLMGPAVVSLSIYQINFMVVSNLASGLAEGSPTALRIAQTMVQLPLGVFAMAIGMVILPSLSHLWARQETEAFKETFSQGLRAVFFVTIPSAVGLAVLRVPLIRLLFETGEFTADNTQMAAFALLFFSVGIWAQSAIQILTQVYYSLQETRTLVRVSLIALAVNLLLSLILLRWTNLEHGALALSLSLTAIVNMLNYLYLLRRHLGRIDGSRIGRSALLSFVAAAVMGGIVAWTANVTEPWFIPYDTWGLLVHVLLAVGIGAATYLSIAWLLRMEELAFVRQMVRPSARRSQDETPTPHYD